MIVAVVGTSVPFGLAQDATWFKTLYTFTGYESGDGYNPAGPVVIGSGGVLHGTTRNGGAPPGGSPCMPPQYPGWGCGTVFSLTPPTSPGGTWTETVLHVFVNDGVNPEAGLVMGSGGVLYGTTHGGGTCYHCTPGTVFSLTPPTSPGGAWTETTLASFLPQSGTHFPNGVVIGNGGVLYGTTATVTGNCIACGSVFSLTPTPPTWTQTVLHSFTGGSDGAKAQARVAIGKGGVLFGTTYGGGAARNGVVYMLTPPGSPGGAWTEAVLYDFMGGSDGANPAAAVVIGSGGVLYGTTYGGGTSNAGTVFSLTPPTSPGGTWTETVLYSFGANPRGDLVIGSGGVLYGTTYGGGAAGLGTVFSLTPPASPGGAWTESVLHNFSGKSGDGAYPVAGVVIGKNGLLYGTTYFGGASGNGTVFVLKP